MLGGKKLSASGDIESQAQADRGLRTVAVFESVKGIVVLLAGFAILLLSKHDLPSVIYRLVDRWHLKKDHPLLERLIELAGMATPENLMLLTALAVGYAAIRFAEAWGLWHEKVWAEWLGILSGCAYIPIEVYEIYRHPGWVTVSVFFVNALIVGYLIYVRLRDG